MIASSHDDTELPSLIRYSRPGRLSKSYWSYFNRHPSNVTDLPLTSIRREGNIDGRAKLPGSPESKSSGASSRASRLRRAWALRVSFATGRTCSGLEIDYGSHSRSNLVARDRGGTTQCRPTGQVVSGVNYRRCTSGN
jgi:hypothetical protein